MTKFFILIDDFDEFFGRSRWSGPGASLIGFVLGALIVGVAFATILTLFLQKQGKQR
jgi:hypothetical protein